MNTWTIYITHIKHQNIIRRRPTKNPNRKKKKEQIKYVKENINNNFKKSALSMKFDYQNTKYLIKNVTEEEKKQKIK